MNFHFKISDGPTNTILFAKYDSIIELNFETHDVHTMYQFKYPLRRQPQFFKTNSDQSIFLLSSAEDGTYVDYLQKIEVDINDELGIEVIKEIVYDDEDSTFYVLANKFEEKLGFFVV